MFYDLNLDDKSYREIEEDAIFRIPGECPEWTNYNQSDPGMMLIGLLSWLKEIQQYHISQIGGWKRQKYLKLLGTGMEHACPAKGAVSVELPAGSLGSQYPILKGARFFAGNMTFETIQKEFPRPIKLIGAYILNGEALEQYVNIGNDLEKRMRLYPFGEQPKAGNRCCFVMDRGFDNGGQTVLTFDICTEYEVARNPIGADFVPLAKIHWEYQSENGWEELPVDFDTTYAFLQSGKIGFHLPGEMVEDLEYGAWQIRVTLSENDYDVAPLIQNIYFNEIEVRQQYSFCDYEDCEAVPCGGGMYRVKSGMYLAKMGQAEIYVQVEGGFVQVPVKEREETREGDVVYSFCWQEQTEEGGALKVRLAAYEKEFRKRRKIGTGKAYANQEYWLDIPDIVYDEFEIMVWDRQDGRFYPYRRVEDFDGCTPEDMVYVLDLAENRLLFGNCENGMAPDGEILLLRLRVCDGQSGNIKAGRIRECGDCPELLVRQYRPTCGGMDNETVEDCYERIRQKLRNINRGVTYADYEQLVRQTPGLLIKDCKVIPVTESGKAQDSFRENEIAIVVRPLSYQKRDKRLSEKYRRNLEQALQKGKMLGTSIRLLNPEYVGIAVFAEIVIRPQFTDAEEMIEEAVSSYVNEHSWEIGKPVSGSVLYGIIDILPCVWQVRSLSVEARGRGYRHLVNGDVKLPPNGLPYLKETDIRIFTAGETDF